MNHNTEGILTGNFHMYYLHISCLQTMVLFLLSNFCDLWCHHSTWATNFDLNTVELIFPHFSNSHIHSFIAHFYNPIQNTLKFILYIEYTTHPISLNALDITIMISLMPSITHHLETHSTMSQSRNLKRKRKNSTHRNNSFDRSVRLKEASSFSRELRRNRIIAAEMRQCHRHFRPNQIRIGENNTKKHPSLEPVTCSAYFYYTSTITQYYSILQYTLRKNELVRWTFWLLSTCRERPTFFPRYTTS